ncbi:hypothetical protein CDL12_04863 [Handroanthus impetiginosus]|uniref:DUF1764 domain-containing protein n=1 Tax=Handroanthus impetiginosus TaxID=429701 RepID=A0A2G9HY83_9LAMI|nr:hypothetical protein CDL12_04863 [Handroanthus impetiginosus]
MTKKGSSKKLAKPSMEDPAVEKEKYSTKPKKMGSEIDDIFAGKKRKKPEKDEKADSEETVKVSAANAKSHDGLRKVKNGKSKSLKDSGIDEPTSRSRRKRTADGLSIYTEEELGIGKPEAGGTPLCPFDCDCCF